MIQSPGPHFCKYDLQDWELEFALTRRGRKKYSTIYTAFTAETVVLSCNRILHSDAEPKSALLGTQLYLTSALGRNSVRRGSDPLQSATKHSQGEFLFRSIEAFCGVEVYLSNVNTLHSLSSV